MIMRFGYQLAVSMYKLISVCTAEYKLITALYRPSRAMM